MRKVIKEFKMSAKNLVRAFGKKIGVLKVTQQQQVYTNATSNCQFFYGILFRTVNESAPAVIAANGKKQQYNKHTACFVIKKQTH